MRRILKNDDFLIFSFLAIGLMIVYSPFVFLLISYVGIKIVAVVAGVLFLFAAIMFMAAMSLPDVESTIWMMQATHFYKGKIVD